MRVPFEHRSAVFGSSLFQSRGVVLLFICDTEAAIEGFKCASYCFSAAVGIKASGCRKACPRNGATVVAIRFNKSLDYSEVFVRKLLFPASRFYTRRMEGAVGVVLFALRLFERAIAGAFTGPMERENPRFEVRNVKSL